jgi:holo-[acyl-carrier-protein] synthase
MNLSSGIDTIEISRIDEIPLSIRERFIQRVFTANEIAQARDRSDVLSGLFAAKEAASKALGTGIGRARWQDFEILHLPSGQPTLHLHGHAKSTAEKHGLTTWSVSISHDRNKAIAVVVAIGE